MTVADRVWNTWSGRWPAAVLHLPSGLGFRVATYSAAEGTYRDHAGLASVRLGPRRVDGGCVSVQLVHAGSVVQLDVARQDPATLVARLRLVERGEWALRFWLLLEVGVVAAPTRPRLGTPTVALYRPELGDAQPRTRVTGSWRSTRLALVTDTAAARAGLYDGQEAVRRGLEDGGYYLPHDDADAPTLAVLRFSGQEQGDVRFALAERTDEGAAAAATDALARVDEVLDDAAAGLAHATPAGAAIRDVVGWNTVWDDANARAGTVLTRSWLGPKFGGYGVWLDDVCYAALLAAVAGEPAVARENLLLVAASAQPAGNLACLLTAHEEWVDRSQPPIAAFVLRRATALTGDLGLVRDLLATLERNHTWWRTTRDPDGSGLCAYGSSPTGQGTFAHTKQGALNESSMDNLPLFDDAVFLPGPATLDLHEVGLNSLLALDAESIAALHALLGDEAAAAGWERRAEHLRVAIRERLWDEERAVFAGRHLNGRFTSRLAPTSFFPLLAGAATPQQAQRLVSGHLLDETRFWGVRPLPASPYDDPPSADDVYWRGRVWPPLVYLVWEGLRRSGFDDVAAELAARAWEMFAEQWARRRCPENLPVRPGQPLGPDSDGFYTWGALLPLLTELQALDENPWWELTGAA